LENEKVRLGYPQVLRLSGVAGFVAVSILTSYLSESVMGAPDVQLGILLSFAFLGTGMLVSRPDFEVLAWVVLGSALLLVLSLLGTAPLLVLVVALGVVCMATALSLRFDGRFCRVVRAGPGGARPVTTGEWRGYSCPP
jgi:hypothetical protein